MAFTSEMFDQLRVLLNDPTDAQVPFATKKLYLNRGIAMLWPRVYVTATANVSLTSGVYEYTATPDMMDGFIISLEINSLSDTSRYIRFDAYDLIPGDEDLAGKFVLPFSPSTGTTVRVRYVTAIPKIAAASYAASQAETWLAPDRAINLPVFYAMGMIASSKIDDRQDTLRYSTTQALNGVDDRDIMAAGQLWFGQFELEVESMNRPLPPARD